MSDPAVDILDIHTAVDQNADAGSAKVMQRQVRTQVLVGTGYPFEERLKLLSCIVQNADSNKIVVINE